VEAKEQCYACKQYNNEFPEDYMYKLKAWADVVKWQNSCKKLGDYPRIIWDQEAKEAVPLEYTLDMAYVKVVGCTRNWVLVSELKNDYSKGLDDYPTAFALANLYETPKNDQIQPQPHQWNDHSHVNNQRHKHNIASETGQYMMLRMLPTSLLLLAIMVSFWQNPLLKLITILGELLWCTMGM